MLAYLVMLICCLVRFLFANIRQQRVVIVELPMLGELPYILPLVVSLSQFSDFVVVIACRNYAEFVLIEKKLLGPDLLSRIHVTDYRAVMRLSRLAHLYITSEQFNLGIDGVPSVCVFHGQPSKGITFSKNVINGFDYFFLLGPLHRRALNRFLKNNPDLMGRLPELFEAGYPKMDKVVKGVYDRQVVLEKLGLDPARKTVLYAPAFNEYATLRTIGQELIATLCAVGDVNIVIKLAPDSINSPENFYATGGGDWKKTLKPFENERCKITDDLDINPYLVAADVMVTDVSGVAYDFHVLGKPVVYVDCPEFYDKYVSRFDPNLSYAVCISDDTINAGRDFGFVVKELPELQKKVSAIISGGCSDKPPRSITCAELLYNPGKAVEASVSKIREILAIKGT
jgi:hypothetical protein